MDDIVARIRSKLAAACTEPVPRPRTFVRAPGGQRLGAPLSEERVVAYEATHGVRLPRSYRTFLREIGNGGVGPDYGLLPLTRWSAHDIPTASQQLGRVFALEPADSVAADWARLRDLQDYSYAGTHTVVAQNPSSKVFTAEATSRVTFAGAGGSRRSLRHRATTASANRSRFSSTGHSSAANHCASWTWSSCVHSRNPNADRTSIRCRLIARPDQS
ncbi:hypothetical protein GA0115234_106892 [Streptomyces sp. DvalAA-43]|nr:hypothetical protein GA0115234_106892 [Streptomyces sp. DvalAA-43]